MALSRTKLIEDTRGAVTNERDIAYIDRVLAHLKKPLKQQELELLQEDGRNKWVSYEINGGETYEDQLADVGIAIAAYLAFDQDDEALKAHQWAVELRKKIEERT